MEAKKPLWELTPFGLMIAPKKGSRGRRDFDSWSAFLKTKAWEDERTFDEPLVAFYWRTKEYYQKYVVGPEKMVECKGIPEWNFDQLVLAFLWDGPGLWYFTIFVTKEDETEVRIFLKQHYHPINL